MDRIVDFCETDKAREWAELLDETPSREEIIEDEEDGVSTRKGLSMNNIEVLDRIMVMLQDMFEKGAEE